VLVQFSQAAAREGTAGPAFGAVSVVDADGNPIVQLQETAFRFAVIAKPGAKGEPMAHKLNQEANGFYMFTLFPGTGGLDQRWDHGDYLVGVQVKDASQQGQAIGVLRVPPRVPSTDGAVPDPNVATLDPPSVEQG
jgi:hypothetical protein